MNCWLCMHIAWCWQLLSARGCSWILFPTIVYIDCVFNSLVQNIVFNYVMPQRIPTDMLCNVAYPPTLTCKIARQLQNELCARDDVFSFIYSVNYSAWSFICESSQVWLLFKIFMQVQHSCTNNVEGCCWTGFPILVGIRISVEQSTIS